MRLGSVLYVIILGPAGSGKTTLTSELSRWIERNEGLRVAKVNLDPAVEILPYKPDFDVRLIVRARDIMLKEGLGPNGAIVKSIDMLAEKGREVVKELARLRADITLVDTPGQSESFLFRHAGPSLVSLIKSLGPAVGVYLGDPTLGLRGSESIIILLMSLIVQLRLDIPTVPVINKSDLVAEEPLEATYHDTLKILKSELVSTSNGILGELSASLADIVEKYLQASRIVRISAKTGEGLDELFKLIHETFCVCGDLT